ncbi:MAG: restriction endonuclease subunit S [Firmicutes bacterium]|nr:restriction endonuclease subunit S [Bacillota bacterium]
MKYKLLKDVCNINMGQSPDSNSYNENGDGVPFFQGNADFGERYPVVKKWCNAPTKMAAPEDILISVRAPIGAVNYAKEDCCIGRGLAAITPDKTKVSPEFIFWLLRGKKDELNDKGTGSTFKAIGRTVLEEILIPDIEIEKQIESAAILEKIYSVMQAKHQEISKLDNLVKARFVEMFGLPGTDKFGWGMVSLGSVCDINPKKSHDNRLCSGLEVSFVPMPAVTESGKIDATAIKQFDEVKTGFTYFAENDVLFAKITPCMENGKGAVAKGLHNGIGFGSTEFHVIRPILDKTNPYWIYTLMAFPQFRVDAANNMTGSAGQRRVPASFLEDYCVAVPPIDLQNRFATFVEQVDKSKFDKHDNIFTRGKTHLKTATSRN